MKNFGCLFLFFSLLFFSQKKKDSLVDLNNAGFISKQLSLKNTSLVPLQAGLYSAILPGMGQYYNKKYWKIPLALGAIGVGIGFIVYNTNLYKRYRNAFVAELNGQTHEFSGIPNVTAEVLGNVQDQYKRQLDYTIAIAIGIYLLNIVDAVIDAHLSEGRKDKDLSIRTSIIENNGKLSPGLAFRFNF